MASRATTSVRAVARTESRLERRGVEAALEARCETFARREADEAIARMSAEGGLTGDQRRIVRELAAAIAGGLLIEPVVDVDTDDVDTRRAMHALFEVDGDCETSPPRAVSDAADLSRPAAGESES